MHDKGDHQLVPNGFRENKLFQQCAMLPSCSLYGWILIQFVSLPLLCVWGHSLCACPLGKTVRLGLVRRHCNVSKLPWQCRRSLFHCLFPSLVSRCEGGGGGGHMTELIPRNTGIHGAVSLSVVPSLTAAATSITCHTAVTCSHTSSVALEYSAANQTSGVCAEWRIV